METILFWVVIATLLIFLFWKTYKLGFRLGYQHGASVVLHEWKQYMNIQEDDE